MFQSLMLDYLIVNYLKIALFDVAPLMLRFLNVPLFAAALVVSLWCNHLMLTILILYYLMLHCLLLYYLMLYSFNVQLLALVLLNVALYYVTLF